MSQATQTIPIAREKRLVDAQNPWPGLAAFGEADSEFFSGRAAESRSLLERILREELTILFGVSGLGKSSLLRAGVFSKLRAKGILPIYIRLDYSSDRPEFGEQVRSEIASTARRAGVEAPSGRAGDTLWEFFHRRGSDFWSSRNRPVTPLLVFDQFEEIFTLGRSSAGRRAATEAFIEELSDLIEGRPPEAVRAQLAEAPETAEEYEFRRHGYKVLLSLREDYLAPLETLRGRAPSIGHNRVRLERMNGVAAMEVASIAPDIMEPDIAESVVRFLAASSEGEADDVAQEVPLADLEIEPALLSVMCRELNNSRKDFGHEKVTEALFKGSADEILADVYERAVNDLGQDVRTFVEEELLTKSGYRDSCALENALDAPGMSEEVIDELVNRRLLRLEARDGMRRVELTHDLLSGVIARSREKRRSREHERKALEERRQKEALERQDRIKARRVQRQRALAITVPILVSLLVFAVIGVWIGYEGKAEAEIERDRALAQQQIAEVRKLTVESSVNLEAAPQRGLLLAMESVLLSEEIEGPILFEAKSALLRALAATSGRPLYQEGAEIFAFSPTDPNYVAASNGRFIRLFDLTQPDYEPVDFEAGEINSLRFDKSGEAIVTVARQGESDEGEESVKVERWGLGGEPLDSRHEPFQEEGLRLVGELIVGGESSSTGAVDLDGMILTRSGSRFAILGSDGVRTYRGTLNTTDRINERIAELESDEKLMEKVAKLQADWVKRETEEIDFGSWYHQRLPRSEDAADRTQTLLEESAWTFRPGEPRAWSALPANTRSTRQSGVVDYYLCAFEVERPTAMRLRADPACSLWVNRERLRTDEAGGRRANVIELSLDPGTNRILLKDTTGRGHPRYVFGAERVVPYPLNVSPQYRERSPELERDLRALFFKQVMAGDGVLSAEERNVLKELAALLSQLVGTELREQIAEVSEAVENLLQQVPAAEAPTEAHRKGFGAWRAQAALDKGEVWVSESKQPDIGSINNEIWISGRTASPKLRKDGWPAWVDHEGVRGRLQESSSKELVQHSLMMSNEPLIVAGGSRLFARVWIDPDSPPTSVMLQYKSSGGWSHRAFWGSKEGLPWGTVGTTTLRHMGPLPALGEWVTLEVDSKAVGLDGNRRVSGLGFSQIGGKVYWAEAGIRFSTAVLEALAKTGSSAEVDALLWEIYVPRLPQAEELQRSIQAQQEALLKLVAQWMESGSTPIQPKAGAFVSIGLGTHGDDLVGVTSEGVLGVWDLRVDPPVATVLPHPAGAVMVAVSPSGTTFASGADDGVVRIWDLDDLTAPSRELRGQESAITSLGFSPSGMLLAASRDSIRLWDLRNPWQGTPRLLHDSAVRAMQFDHDGCTLSTGTENGDVRVWEIRDFIDETGSVMTRSPKAEGDLHRSLGPPPGGPVTSVAFSPDGKTLAISSLDSVALWSAVAADDWKDGNVDHMPLSLGSHSVAFASDNVLATGGPLNFEQWVRRIGAPKVEPEVGDVRSAIEKAMSEPDPAETESDKELVVYSRLGPELNGKSEADRAKALGDVQGGIDAALKKGPKDESARKSTDWSRHDPSNSVTLTARPHCFFFEVEFQGELICEVPRPRGSTMDIFVDENLTFYRSLGADDAHVAFSLVEEGENWLVEEGVKRVFIAISSLSNTQYSMTPRLISKYEQLELMSEHLVNWREHAPRMLSEEDAALAWFRSSPYKAVSGLAERLSEGLGVLEKRFVDAQPDVYLWDLAATWAGANSGPRVLEGSGDAPLGLSADPSLLVAETRPALHVWDVKGGKELPGYGVRDGEQITATAMSSEWLALAVSSKTDEPRNLIRLVHRGESELDLHAREVEMSGHDGIIHSLVFSRGGDLLASGSADRTARIWDVSDPTREPIELPRENTEVLAVAFGPKDEWLAVAGVDGSVRLWPLRLDALLRIARQRVGRDLTESEWSRYLGGRPFRRTLDAAGH